MKFVFRVDASAEMGGGHLYRCMNLAASLRASGLCECFFLMREHHAGFIESVKLAGFEVITLPLEFKPRYFDGDYTQWVGGDVKTEIEAMLDLLSEKGFRKTDWVVTDHYGLDRSYEVGVKAYGLNVAVIDDLANRSHQCDLLVDQTCGRYVSDYKGLVNENALICVGQEYCLLRPEFILCRTEALERRKVFSTIKNILVNFGSTDPTNITANVLTNIKDYCVKESIVLNVVLGASAPHLKEVGEVVGEFPGATLHVEVSNMAELMKSADIAIGAAGSTTWERCCMGLPTVLVKTAENQSEVVSRMLDLGVVFYHDLSVSNQTGLLLDAFAAVSNDYQNLSKRAARLVDGKGLERIKNILLGEVGC